MAEQTVTVGVGALSIEDVIAVARGGAKVAISDESKHEMALSRAVIDHLADDTVPHYGISTGFGALASTSIPKENSAHGYMTLKDGVFTWKTLDGEKYHEVKVCP